MVGCRWRRIRRRRWRISRIGRRCRCRFLDLRGRRVIGGRMLRRSRRVRGRRVLLASTGRTGRTRRCLDHPVRRGFRVLTRRYRDCGVSVARRGSRVSRVQRDRPARTATRYRRHRGTRMRWCAVGMGRRSRTRSRATGTAAGWWRWTRHGGSTCEGAFGYHPEGSALDPPGRNSNETTVADRLRGGGHLRSYRGRPLLQQPLVHRSVPGPQVTARPPHQRPDLLVDDRSRPHRAARRRGGGHGPHSSDRRPLTLIVMPAMPDPHMRKAPPHTLTVTKLYREGARPCLLMLPRTHTPTR